MEESQSLDDEPTHQKIPPIFVQCSDWLPVAKKLMTTLPGTTITVKAHSGSTLKILCIDESIFRMVQKYLTKTKTDFYTHPLPEERSLRVIIKGIPEYFSESQITEELTSRGYDVKTTKQFANSQRKYRIHLITLTSSPSSKQIFNETSLFFISIQVESYRSNKPAQCYACQRFGHSSRHCGYAPRCVKCAGPHLARDCAKTQEEDPKCVNCDGTHTANYTKCPALLKEKETRRPTRPNTASFPSESTFPKLSSNSPPTQDSNLHPTPASYASVISGSSSPLKPDLTKVILQLNDLTASLSNGKGKVKDTLIALLAILPLLLNHHNE
jgi:hypothetical protein